jgi:hypothetical protein
MATTPAEMFYEDASPLPDKRLDQCASPGCSKLATFWPHKNPNVRFCEQHALRIIRATVESIVDGTHPDCAEEAPR